MTLLDLASIGNFVGGIAVLATLLFLTLQIRQSTKHQKALLQQGRAMRNVELTVQFSDPEIAWIYQRGGAGDVQLTTPEVATFRRAFTATILSFEDGFIQRRMGLLNQASAASDIRILKTIFSQPGFRAMWRMLRPSFDTEFVKFLDDLIRETPLVEPPNVAVTWRTLVTQERALPVPPARP